MAERAVQEPPNALARLRQTADRPLARRVGASPLPPEQRAPAHFASAGTGPVRRPIPAPDQLPPIEFGLPLLRRTRLARTRLETKLAGSAATHAVLLTILALLFANQAGLQSPQEPQSVEMVYGQSGMVGNPVSPDQGGGARPPPTPAQPVPTPPPPTEQPEVNTELPDVTLPPPSPPQPDSPPQPAPSRPMRVPRREAQARSSNPFAHPMDLSLSQDGPPRTRRGRASGSGSAIDLSLGPLVKNGTLNSPFATVSGVKGVSDDYGAEIDSWIRHHLYYPPEAADRGEDGPSHVHVVIDRSGHVKSVRLVDSSGSFTLDSSTEGMFRGRTLPPVPPDMVGNQFDIDLTVNYILTH